MSHQQEPEDLEPENYPPADAGTDAFTLISEDDAAAQQQPTALPTGRDLFTAWIDAFTERRGQAPDASVHGPLRGQVSRIVKSRSDLESWRQAWRAARACGLRGDWRICDELIGVESRYKPKGTNHYLANLKAGVHSRPALGSVASAAFAALPAPTDPPTRGIQP